MKNHRSLLTPSMLASIVSAATLLAGCSGSSEPPVAKSLSPQTSAVASLPPTVAPMPAESVPVPTPAPSAEDVKAAWQQGVALFEAKDYVGAAIQLEIAAEGRGSHAYTHYLLGLALSKSGESDRAEKALVRAAELDPRSTKAWINLARVRLELAESQSALEAADAALDIDPSSADALHQKGRALANLKRVEEALDLLKSAHEAAPDNGQIANTLGYWLLESGKVEDALPILESARDRLPGVAYVRNNLGSAYERLGRRDEAASEYRAAVESGDPGGKAAVSLARVGGSGVGVPVATAKPEEERASPHQE